VYQKIIDLEFYIYIILFLSATVFLNTHVVFSNRGRISFVPNITIIEQLSKYSNKPKNYRFIPEGYQTFGYGIYGYLKEETALLYYDFPMIDGKDCRFEFSFHSKNFSSVISQFGAPTSCLNSSNGRVVQLQSADPDFLAQNMNRDGFFFKSFNSSDWGVDYNHLLDISSDLHGEIAYFIAKHLQAKGLDNYVNRVSAALNFVQFIPYGVPSFDKDDFCYFGIAMPHESIAISYSDCDSKSILLAGILSYLIPEENIVLVLCEMDKVGHMVTGVSGLPYQGQLVTHANKQYLLLETTTPIPIDQQHDNKFTNTQVVDIKAA